MGYDRYGRIASIQPAPKQNASCGTGVGLPIPFWVRHGKGKPNPADRVGVFLLIYLLRLNLTTLHGCVGKGKATN